MRSHCSCAWPCVREKRHESVQCSWRLVGFCQIDSRSFWGPLDRGESCQEHRVGCQVLLLLLSLLLLLFLLLLLLLLMMISCLSLLLSDNSIVSPYLLVISLPINICLFLSFFVYELWVSQIARKFRLLSTNTCMWTQNWCFASWMIIIHTYDVSERLFTDLPSY